MKRSNKSNKRNKVTKFDSKEGIKTSKFKEESTGGQPRSNNIAWYDRNPRLLESAGRISTANPLGERISTAMINHEQVGDTVLIKSSVPSIPGIMTIDLVPTVGGTFNQEGIINDIAKDFYANVRYANSGKTNYESTDLMISTIAMCAPYALYGFLTRLYGVMRNYYPTNRYNAEALVTAMGINFKDMEEHIADLYYYTEQFRSRLGQFFIPKDFPILTKQVWAFANVYKDSPLEKSQMYLFNPRQIYKYAPRTSDTGGTLTPVDFLNSGSGTTTTFSALTTLCNEIIQALVEDEDIGIISGDIKKAYGVENCYYPNPINLDYRVEPIYDPDTLYKIENARLWPGLGSTIQQIITQDDTYLTGNLYYAVPSSSLPRWTIGMIKPIYNSHEPNPDSARIMEDTRLTFSVSVNATTNQMAVSVCDVFVATNCRIWNWEWNSNGIRSLRQHLISETGVLTTTSATTELMTLLSKFGHAPIMYLVQNTTASGVTTIDVKGILGDLENYTFLEDNVLDKLNQTALMSEFDFPQRKS